MTVMHVFREDIPERLRWTEEVHDADRDNRFFNGVDRVEIRIGLPLTTYPRGWEGLPSNVADPGGPVAGAGGAAAGLDRLSQALLDLGFADDEPARLAAAAILRAGLPLTAPHLRAVMAALGRLPESAPVWTAHAAALLLARGLPPADPLLGTLAAYLAEPPAAGLLLQHLVHALRRSPAGQGPQAEPVQRLLRLLGESVIVPADAGGGGPTGLAHVLERAMRALGLDHERAWVAWLLGPGGSLSHAGGRRPADTVKGLLLAIRGPFDPAAARQGSAEPPLRGVIEQTLRAVTAWQVLSGESTTPGQSAGQTQLVFQLPLLVNGQLLTAGFSIRQTREREQAEPEEEWRRQDQGSRPARMSATLRLDLPHLGSLAVDLTLCGPRLTLGVFARDPAALELLAAGREGLEAGLRQQGFDVGPVRFRPLSETDSDGWADPPAGGLDLVG